MADHNQTFDNFYKKVINGKKGNLFTRMEWLENQVKRMKSRDVNNFLTQIIQNNQEIIMPTIKGATANPYDPTFTGVIISPNGIVFGTTSYSFAIVENGVVVSGFGDDGGLVVSIIGLSQAQVLAITSIGF